jgi:hypothetical protein
MRLLMLAAMWMPAVGFSVLTMSLAAVKGSGYFFALVLAAGAIGQDVSSGVLQLTFARPVKRSTYVLSRWFAAGAGGAVLGLLQLAATALLLGARGAWPGPLPLVSLALGDIVMAFTAAAVMVGLSSLVGGLGDLALFALATISLQLASGVAGLRGWTLAHTLLDEAQRTLQPRVDFAWLAGQGAPAWTDLVTAVSTTALFLLVAIVVLNRKELSYAAD